MLCCLKAIVFDWRCSLLRYHDVKRNPPLVRSKFQLSFLPTTCCACGECKVKVLQFVVVRLLHTEPELIGPVHLWYFNSCSSIDRSFHKNQPSEAQGKDFSRKSKWKLHTYTLTHWKRGHKSYLPSKKIYFSRALLFKTLLDLFQISVT